MSKYSESASASASGSALGLAVAKVLIISSSETPTISMWSTDGAGGTGGNDGLLTQMERCSLDPGGLELF